MNKGFKLSVAILTLTLTQLVSAKDVDANPVQKLDKAFLNCKINFDKNGSKSKFQACQQKHDIIAADTLTDLLGVRATDKEWIDISDKAIVQIGFCKDAIVSSENKTTMLDEALCGHQYYKSLIISAIDYTK